jgi:hypothetical protein
MNANKTLRYGLKLDSAHDEDKDRKFILFYYLSDNSLSIMELNVANSGIIGGKFLSRRKVMNPYSNPNLPQFYLPKDFSIGTTIHIFAHRFIITSVDFYVYRYMQAYPELFHPNIIESVRIYLLENENLKPDVRRIIADEQLRYVNEVKKKSDIIEDEGSSDNNVNGIPKPVIQEDEIKKFYHEHQEHTPPYMQNEKCNLACNVNVKEDFNIPNDKSTVRFLEPHETATI